MKKGFFQAPVKREIVKQQGELLHNHTTPIIGYIEQGEGRTKYQQLGSGVFVATGKIFGILTAQHVSNQIRDFEGIALPISQGIGRYLIRKEHLGVLEPVKPQSTDFGPDLSFIKLSVRDAGTIKAHKVFCNLEVQIELLARQQPSLHEGIWYACGAPFEQATIRAGGEVFERIHTYKTYSCELRPQTDFEKKDFDYIDAVYKYSEYQFPPISFGGFSGGGIWQVIVGNDENGNTITDNRLLAGIVFYQSPLEHGTRMLRAHFRKSIYTKLYNHIHASFSA